MRIAHIGSKGLPSKGGTERVVEAIATRHATEHDVTVYGSRRVCRSGLLGGVRVVALPTLSSRHLGPVLLDVQAAASAFFGGYDVVHIHGAENAFVAPILRLRSRVVTTNHGPAHERKKWGRWARAIMRSTERVSVRSADAATAVAASHAEGLTARYGIPVRHIPNGIDSGMTADTGSAATMLASLGIEPNKYVMFAAARVDPTKGCLTLIRAWRAAATGLPLLVVGDLWHAPGHEEELRSAAEGADVVFVPRVEDRDVLLGLVSLASLFVVPSTIEAMSMMLLEAVSTGAQVLASDIPENAAVLPDGFPLFRAGEEDDLKRAIVEALSEPRAESRSRHAGFARQITDSYGWDSIAEQYLSAYRGP